MFLYDNERPQISSVFPINQSIESYTLLLLQYPMSHNTKQSSCNVMLATDCYSNLRLPQPIVRIALNKELLCSCWREQE